MRRPQQQVHQHKRYNPYLAHGLCSRSGLPRAATFGLKLEKAGEGTERNHWSATGSHEPHALRRCSVLQRIAVAGHGHHVFTFRPGWTSAEVSVRLFDGHHRCRDGPVRTCRKKIPNRERVVDSFRTSEMHAYLKHLKPLVTRPWRQ